MPIAEMRKALGDRPIPIYAGIEHGYCGLPHREATLHAAAHGLLESGADGIYVFNWSSPTPRSRRTARADARNAPRSRSVRSRGSSISGPIKREERTPQCRADRQLLPPPSILPARHFVAVGPEGAAEAMEILV